MKKNTILILIFFFFSFCFTKRVIAAVVSKSNDSVIYYEGSGSMKVQQGAPQVDANTVALWHFDETNGDLAGDDVFDETANNNDGELNGTAPGPEPVEGIFGKARDFNGTDDYVSVTDSSSLDVAGDLTLSAWIKLGSTPSNDVIIGKYGAAGQRSYMLYLANFSQINMIVSGDGTNVVQTQLGTGTWGEAGEWYYIVGVYTAGSKLETFINGASFNTKTTSIPASIFNSGTALEVGRATGYTYHFDGIIDEVRISDTARTAEEIAEAYRMGRDHRLSRTISSADLSAKTKIPFFVAADRPGTFLEATVGESNYVNGIADANTVGYWHLEEDSGYCDSGETGCVKDSSSSGNDGTPSGDPTTTQGKIGKGWDFDGSDDYITVPHNASLDLSGNKTIEAWIYLPSSDLQDYPFIVNKRASYPTYALTLADGVGYGADRYSIAFFFGSDTTNYNTYSNTLYTDHIGEWIYIVGTYDGSDSKIYWNGQLDITNNVGSVTSNTDSSALAIGNDSDGGAATSIKAIIDEVRISNTARSAEDIRQAYEIGKRTHPITIDFSDTLNNANLIADSNDTSFTLNNANNEANNLFKGDKIIVKENYGGTEYIAQGDVTAVNASTGAVTVDAWDAGSTFPASGFTQHANVFKWQREWFDITSPLSSHIDATTLISFRVTDGSEGRTFWLDDFKSGGAYLTDGSASSNVTSTVQRYLQYRFVASSTDTAVSPYISSVTVNYTTGPALNQLMRHGKWFSSGVKQGFWWCGH